MVITYAATIADLHTVKGCPVDRSYGLQVATLAGIPKAVISEAQARLATMEAESRQRENKAPSAPPPQLGLFAAENPVLEELRNLDVENLTPKQALDVLYKLKKKS